MKFHVVGSRLALMFAVSVAGITPAFGASVHRGNIEALNSRVHVLQQHVNAALQRNFGFAVNEFTSADEVSSGIDKDILEASPTELAIQNALSTAAIRVAGSVTRIENMNNMINFGADAASINAQAVMLCSEVAGARALVAGSRLRATTSFDAGIYAQGTAAYFAMTQAIDDAQFVTQSAQCGF
ncbi:MAG: hypothetical protein FJ146_05410 [Deltaproteobacteria bacterium]|nr:hypothetical protein [Deltaproteobacteria bacterium]